MRRTVVDPRFHATLINLMRGHGVSGKALATSAGVSRSYLSELINGKAKQPSRQVAAALDNALGAGGRLVNLVALAGDPDDLDQVVATASARTLRSVPLETVDAFSRVLGAQRHLDDQIGSAALLGPTTAHLDLIAGMVLEAVGPTRPDLLRVATQWAQFAGWLHISTGRWVEARQWLSTALEWSLEIGDPDLTATVVSYQGHLAWLRGQFAPALGLSMAVLRDERSYPGQRAYDALQAARCHAALGDLAEADRMADAAETLIAETETFTGEVPPWQYYRESWFWEMERGLVQLRGAWWDPRRAHTAADALARGIDAIPEQMQGADWAGEYLVHLATAQTRADDPEAARTTLDRARTIAEATSSDRIRDLVAGRERALALRA